jgi:hypothetical protein
LLNPECERTFSILRADLVMQICARNKPAF